MMSLCTHPDGQRVDLVVIGLDRAVWHYWAPTPDGLDGATADPLDDPLPESMGGIAKSVTATWAADEYVIAVQGLHDQVWLNRYLTVDGVWTGWIEAPAGARVIAPANNL